MGDTGMKGDTWYREIVGNYRNSAGALEQIYTGGQFKKDVGKYDRLTATFEGFAVPWKGSGYLYKIPVLTLLPEATSTITLKVEIKEAPSKITLKQRKKTADEKDCFSFNVSEIPVRSGKYALENFLKIKCTTPFKRDQYIDVFADEEHCGTIKVLANDPSLQKKVKVLFVSVSSTAGAGATTGEADRLKTYMKQAYINADIKTIRINVAGDAQFDRILRSNGNIHQYLDGKLSAMKFANGNTVGRTYDSYYRVYFIHEIIQMGSGGYLLGRAQGIPSKAVFVLNLQGTAQAAGIDFESVKTTATHELLHAMGLYHTFDNDSLFTFEKYKTDNIMDYYTQSTDIKARQTYKWQWDKLRKALS